MQFSCFGLHEDPFKITPDQRFLYRHQTAEETLDNLWQKVVNRDGVMLLVGESGTGKTVLLQQLRHRLEAGNCLVFNSAYPKVSFDDLLASLCREAGIPARDGSRTGRIGRLGEVLNERLAAGGTAAVLMDEAQNLNDDVLLHLHLLTDLRAEDRCLLPFVLAGLPQLEAMFNRPDVLQVLDPPCCTRLQALDLREIGAYIAHRMQVAGFDGGNLFTPEAIARIAQYSRGIPGLVNRICGAALLQADIESLRVVLAETIDEAAKACALWPPAAADRPAPGAAEQAANVAQRRRPNGTYSASSALGTNGLGANGAARGLAAAGRSTLHPKLDTGAPRLAGAPAATGAADRDPHFPGAVPWSDRSGMPGDPVAARRPWLFPQEPPQRRRRGVRWRTVSLGLFATGLMAFVAGVLLHPGMTEAPQGTTGTASGRADAGGARPYATPSTTSAPLAGLPGVHGPPAAGGLTASAGPAPGLTAPRPAAPFLTTPGAALVTGGGAPGAAATTPAGGRAAADDRAAMAATVAGLAADIAYPSGLTAAEAASTVDPAVLQSIEAALDDTETAKGLTLSYQGAAREAPPRAAGTGSGLWAAAPGGPAGLFLTPPEGIGQFQMTLRRRSRAPMPNQADQEGAADGAAPEPALVAPAGGQGRSRRGGGRSDAAAPVAEMQPDTAEPAAAAPFSGEGEPAVDLATQREMLNTALRAAELQGVSSAPIRERLDAVNARLGVAPAARSGAGGLPATAPALADSAHPPAPEQGSIMRAPVGRPLDLLGRGRNDNNDNNGGNGGAGTHDGGSGSSGGSSGGAGAAGSAGGSAGSTGGRK